MSLPELGLDAGTLAATSPHSAVPEIVSRLVDSWSGQRARLFANIVLREGAGESGFPGLTALIARAREQLEKPFRRWQHEGLLRHDVSVEQLVWELFAPLHVIRFLHLHAGATHTDLTQARQMADDHVAFFLTCVTTSEGSM